MTSENMRQAFFNRVATRLRTRGNSERERALEGELADAHLMISQLTSIVQSRGESLPPPIHLQRRIINRSFDRFLEEGDATIQDFERLLAHEGKSISLFASILDFGCGCGRLARPLAAHLGSPAKLDATDIDAEAIEWCQQNYSSLGIFEVNAAWPPLRYSDNTFDLIYGVSVFTHLPEDMQLRWLEELNRILAPDGYLILSTHGTAYYNHLNPEQQSQLQARGFLYFNNGLTPGLPEFYQTTFHTHDYVRRQWTNYVRVVAIESRGILGRQDAILCRKRPR
jgi:SAM-dependent methyltransferase